ncbi:hypothetical protein [Lysobacter gummosus]|uniref:hypothetical protein n=1 Tax=Lysobacter gummosus TaxID=262324 RepID=UPI00363D41E1
MKASYITRACWPQVFTHFSLLRTRSSPHHVPRGLARCVAVAVHGSSGHGWRG